MNSGYFWPSYIFLSSASSKHVSSLRRSFRAELQLKWHMWGKYPYNKVRPQNPKNSSGQLDSTCASTSTSDNAQPSIGECFEPICSQKGYLTENVHVTKLDPKTPETKAF